MTWVIKNSEGAYRDTWGAWTPEQRKALRFGTRTSAEAHAKSVAGNWARAVRLRVPDAKMADRIRRLEQRIETLEARVIDLHQELFGGVGLP